jgi:uncharacterized protein
MAASVLVDASFLVALLVPRDENHLWAKIEARKHPIPWLTCDAVLSETFYVAGRRLAPPIIALLRRRALRSRFDLGADTAAVLNLMEKYANVPMSFADACLVRMTELLAEPILLATDSDFRLYRRHSRRAVPCVLPL